MQKSESVLLSESYLRKIESHLCQLKIMVAVVIILMLLNLFGVGTILEAATTLIFWTAMVLAGGYLFLLVLELLFFRKSKKADQELAEKIMRDFESDRE